MAGPDCPQGGAGVAGAGGLAWLAPGRMPRRRSRRRRVFRRVRRLLGVALALGLLGAITFAGLLLVAPSVTNAPALARSLAGAHGVAYPGPPVPERFAAALVAAQDRRFYSEAGIDPFALARVALGRLAGRPAQGGTSLDQRLAAMLYTPGRTGVLAGAEQVLVAIKLNFSYPKAQILQMYAAVSYFGHGFYGLAAASCGYFGEPPGRLSWAQAAMLAGVVQAPSADDPLAHPAAARARQAEVLGQLVAGGRLTRAQAARAYRQPLRPAAGRVVYGRPGAGATTDCARSRGQSPAKPVRGSRVPGRGRWPIRLGRASATRRSRAR